MDNSCFQIDDSIFDKFSGVTLNARARKKVLESLARRTWQGTALVTYQSAGKILIVDHIRPDADRDRAITIANDLAAQGFNCTVLIRGLAPKGPDSISSLSRPAPDVTVIAGQLGELGGFLGRFSATLEVLQGDARRENFDLVLDLNTPAFLPHEVSPPGYYAPGADPEKLPATVQAIAQAQGTFSKPVYVKYQANICTHGSKGMTGCTRCLDRCPAEAIRSRGEKIEVNTSLCQGCGSCTVACPTGALSYTFPTVQEWLLMIRDLLAAYRDAGGAQPELLIYDAQGAAALLDQAGTLPDNLIPVPVEAIGSVGMDAWLSALAYGAGSVALLIGEETPASILAGLQAQFSVTHNLLKEMGYAEDRLRLIVVNADNTFAISDRNGKDADHPAALFNPFEKRRTIRMALDHLYQHAPKPRKVTALPAGAPFGEIRVDQNTCTLCMSCVAICPVQALQQDVQQLQLSFLEAHCVQCGLCQNICPEHSITLVSRYLYDDRLAGKPCIVNEDQPFCCIACGKPFISKRMFDKIAEKLAAAGNWKVEQQVTPQWLQMCGDCRVKGN